MSYCGQWSSVKHEPGRLRLATLKCRAWGCETCQPNRRRQLVAEACRGRPDTFITLTLHAKAAENPEEAVKSLSRAWRLIRKRHTRLHPDQKLPFLAVVERTKRGTPHLHILARSRWIDQRWLAAAMKEITGSYIVDIRRPKMIRRIAAYAAKYIGKDPAKIGKTKRYWQSQDYQIDKKDALPPLPPGHYYDRPLKCSLAQAKQDWESMGFKCWYEAHDRLIIDTSSYEPRRL